MDLARPTRHLGGALVNGAIGSERSSYDPPTRYIRDCGNRIVRRSYVADEAADMRRKTESIII